MSELRGERWGVLDPYVSSFLDYLGVDRQGPSLDYLNMLVRQHQL